MPCEPIVENGRVTGFACSRKYKPRPKCYVCGAPAISLCDHYNNAFDICSKAMCKAHRHHVAKDTDYCEEHFNEFSMQRSNKAEARFKQLCLDIEGRK